MRFLVQTRLAGRSEESYVTVAAPEDAREAVAIAKFLRVPDPLDGDSEPLRRAIVVDEQAEEAYFDGILRAEHQLGQLDPEIAERLVQVGKARAPMVSDEDMRQFVHSYSWPAAGLEGGS